MGLLDEIGKLAGSGDGNSASSSPIAAITQILCDHPGGLSGLAQAFDQQGLGHLISSWIGTDQNLPVSGDQITQVLGNTQIGQIAQKFGITPEMASSAVAQYLPQIIDHITPNGQAPEGGLLSQCESILGSLLNSQKSTPQ